ncbi:glycosyl hydrolases family 2, TIM barrel domain-containing protein [Lophiotrema nucula]|uniref:beta-galactosidase n=1 Tax=Lophiotrema nucula TaxID=690887 RepID=A0A6A5Z255_9PLEO|nr:glycosyl hydrolases family 2, TIM barrel domain-containing protein [Lophiotrema nucula]
MTSTTGIHPTGVPDWNNLSVLHRNTLPLRAYFWNYTSESDALKGDVAKSKTHSLCGSWKFHHSYSPYEALEGFEAPSFDISQWSDIAVPGMWQLQGYGKGPQYTNVIFPIPVDPPNVPFAENETGSYVRRFTIPEQLKGDQIRLRFEGVDSSFHVWVNGKEIGYSQGSRNPDEFDITDAVVENGENILAVRVYQWCDGTYIEDQDQWWLSGIFRDVFLVAFPKVSRIENVFTQTELDAAYVDARLNVKVTVAGSGQLKMTLFDPHGNSVGTCSQGDTSTTQNPVTFSLVVEEPLKWTAETPHLYRVVFSFNGQYISHRVGFRKVEMKDGLIKVNGKRVVFRGVNRHEHHPQFGRAVPYESLKEDLLIMKRHNINAIRTSHQPNDPRLYDLADEMGFWVIDEADLECHGFESIADAALNTEERKLPFRQRQLLTRTEAAKWTTDNPEWTHAYVDRAQQLVVRDQLHASVIIWSLGNEAFFGRNFKEMYKWIKGYDGSRPIHYEADIFAETMDMYSRMYPPIDEIVEFGEDTSKAKPLILCEYIHAMGNGPGNIKEYIDAFYKYPKLQGGFAWEWANHGLFTKDHETGDEFYAYGGDFGDVPNDSTFVMDGLVDSQHRPAPGLIEYSKAIEPVQLLSYDNKSVTFINRYDFTTLDHLEGFISSAKFSGHETKFDVARNIGPGESFLVNLEDVVKQTAPSDEVLLNFSFRLKHETLCLPKHFEVANAQVPILTNTTLHIRRQLSTPAQQLRVNSPTQNVLQIEGEGNKWSFNTLHGTLTSWTKSLQEVIATAPEVNFFRAPTDNDIPQDGWDWQDKKLHLAKVQTLKVEWKQTAHDEVTVTTHQRVAPPILSWSIDCVLTYNFRSEGALTIHVTGRPRGQNLPRTLPRIGLVMELPKEWRGVSWTGRGPGESYRDSKLSQKIAQYYVSRVDDLWQDYEVPQESSNRTDTRSLELFNQVDDTSLHIQFMEVGTNGQESFEKQRELFDWQASHYRMQDVADAKHPCELRKMKKAEVILRLDAEHHGLGSGSCGPRTLDEYACLTKDFEFAILMQ